MTRRYDSLLNKVAANYDDMFAPLYAVAPQAKSMGKQFITWAKTTLKKQDRVAWYLKWARLSAALVAQTTNTTPELEQMVERLLNEASSKSGVDRAHITDLCRDRWRYIQRQLEHFYAMGIDAIDEYHPSWESPEGVLSFFEKAEEEAIEEASSNPRLLTPKDGDEIFINLGGGWAWWLLDRGMCHAEGAAMGHCGNTAAGKYGEHILSLRKSKKTSGVLHWEPFCTFILDANGMLGEMKGRANKKPTKNYHAAIVALLSDKRIAGIKGGGYAPEENFRFNDLTDEQQEVVEAANPDFQTDPFSSYYRTGKLSDSAISMLESEFESEYMEGHGLVYAHWDTGMKMLADCGDQEIRDAIRGLADAGVEEICDKLFEELSDDDPILKNLVQSIKNEFPGLAPSLPDDSSRDEVKALTLEMMERYPTSQFSEAVSSCAVVSEASIASLVDKWNDDNGAAFSLYKGRNGSFYYACDIDSAIESHNEDYASPPEGVYIRAEDENLDVGDLHTVFDHPLPAPKRVDQDRLYDEPRTEEEARQKGIKQSRKAAVLKLRSWENTDTEPQASPLPPQPNSSADLTSFMKDMRSGTTENPFDGHERVWENVIGIECRPFNGMIHISAIRSFERGKGNASTAMKWLCSLADKHNVSLDCDASPFGDGKNRLSKGQLVTWYKRLGFKTEGGALIRRPVGSKRAYLAPRYGELAIDIRSDAHPQVTLGLDLGLPSLPQFTATFPSDGLSVEDIQTLSRQALEALLEDVAANLLSLNYDENVILEALTLTEGAFHAMKGEDSSDSQFTSRDQAIRSYSKQFSMPEAFVDETQAKMVTGAKRPRKNASHNMVRCDPPVVELVFNTVKPVDPVAGAQRSIELERLQTIHSTPRPFELGRIEPHGNPLARGPKPNEWEARLPVV